MASDPGFVAYVCEQLGGAGEIARKKMFGEWALYAGGKLVALVCEDQLFVKPTAAGRALLGTVDEASPYPGAKRYFRIGGQLDDRELMARLVAATETELPAPPPKRPRRSVGP